MDEQNKLEIAKLKILQAVSALEDEAIRCEPEIAKRICKISDQLTAQAEGLIELAFITEMRGR